MSNTREEKGSYEQGKDPVCTGFLETWSTPVSELVKAILSDEPIEKRELAWERLGQRVMDIISHNFDDAERGPTIPEDLRYLVKHETEIISRKNDYLAYSPIVLGHLTYVKQCIASEEKKQDMTNEDVIMDSYKEAIDNGNALVYGMLNKNQGVQDVNEIGFAKLAAVFMMDNSELMAPLELEEGGPAHVGGMDEEGDSVLPANALVPQIIPWLEKFARAGSYMALVSLATLHQSFLKSSQDISKAATYYRVLADFTRNGVSFVFRKRVEDLLINLLEDYPDNPHAIYHGAALNVDKERAQGLQKAFTKLTHTHPQIILALSQNESAERIINLLHYLDPDAAVNVRDQLTEKLVGLLRRMPIEEVMDLSLSPSLLPEDIRTGMWQEVGEALHQGMNATPKDLRNISLDYFAPSAAISNELAGQFKGLDSKASEITRTNVERSRIKRQFLDKVEKAGKEASTDKAQDKPAPKSPKQQ